MSASSILLIVVALAVMCIALAAILVAMSEIDTYRNRLAAKRMSVFRRQLVAELSRMSSKR